jgi:8-oxo-dGTP pyrophosphatase MutT (NUDIX family)
VKGKKRASAARRPQKRETSAGGVVARVDHGRRLYLLIRDSHGNWGFPKGHLERGEQPESAALREVAEETGVGALTLVAPIDPIDWVFTWRGTVIKKKCHFFLMQTSVEQTRPQAAEGITECRWTTLDDALALLRYDNARAVLRTADKLADSPTAQAVGQ